MLGPRTLDTFCRLLAYPGEQTLQASELLYIILQSELPAAATEIARFGAFLERHADWEVEEAYTATFEVNPACALEIGWHLFGEEYDRGLLLVRLREELRQYGLPETGELPDHLSNVLPLIGAMPAEEARRFVTACVLPAVQKMQQALSRSQTPYAAVVNALLAALQSAWGEGRPLLDGSRLYRADGQAIPHGVDLLHAFPAAEVRHGCGGCHDGCEGHHDHDEHHDHDHDDSIPTSGAAGRGLELPLVQLSDLFFRAEETR